METAVDLVVEGPAAIGQEFRHCLRFFLASVPELAGLRGGWHLNAITSVYRWKGVSHCALSNDDVQTQINFSREMKGDPLYTSCLVWPTSC